FWMRIFYNGWRLALLAILLTFALDRAPSRAVAAPAFVWPTITPVQVLNGLSQPTYLTNAGDGSGRIFVVEQSGRIRIIKSGVLQPTPFLDITSRVRSGGEQGLLSVAFPPGYASKGYFFVDYTSNSGVGDTHVSRFNVSGNPDVADTNSEQVILTVVQPEENHNGGQLQFGPDGYLYIGMGDGGGGGDNHGTRGNAQEPAALLGKLLRINVVPPAPSPPPLAPPPTGNFFYYFPIVGKANLAFSYLVPATNPFTQTAGYRGEIWALGVRNPWRFSFDRQTGDLYVGEVGQNAWEEVDFQSASSTGGENYGWRCYEGNHPYNTSGCLPQNNYVAAVAEYSHSFGCSIIGGYVYRGSAYPSLQGIYFYSDICSGRIWGLVNSGGWQTQQLYLFGSNPSMTTFGEDEAGNVYTAGQNGVLYKITSP
ncbi:MAG TPA: PQQ-dependent sugar dehydrogenase, partial [Anaerolineae bacterium]